MNYPVPSIARTTNYAQSSWERLFVLLFSFLSFEGRSHCNVTPRFNALIHHVIIMISSWKLLKFFFMVHGIPRLLAIRHLSLERLSCRVFTHYYGIILSLEWRHYNRCLGIFQPHQRWSRAWAWITAGRTCFRRFYTMTDTFCFTICYYWDCLCGFFFPKNLFNFPYHYFHDCAIFISLFQFSVYPMLFLTNVPFPLLY